MACFVVGGGEAIVVSALTHAVKKHEVKQGIIDNEGNQIVPVETSGIAWTRKLKWLSNMLWGGVALLAIEHIWHGEVVPWYPFLTAMQTPAEVPAMLHEMATVGVGMAALVTLTWLVIAFAADALAKRGALAQA
ncbi:MAG: hypothetical protein IJV62_04880 [Eggerthellaceae bacterium]|nr:hypothetical protein [Eggerthellaceae bacterium]